jgi:hypothetical protein
MRRYLIAGISLCATALLFLTFSLLVPVGNSRQVAISAPEGIDGVLTVNLPERGWAGDWVAVSASFTSAGSAEASQPLTIRFKLESTEAETQPGGSILAVILPGDGTSAAWKLRTQRKGAVENILWVFGKGQGGEEQLLFAREFTYQSLYYGFVSPIVGRVLAVAMAVIGIILLAVVKFYKPTSRE